MSSNNKKNQVNTDMRNIIIKLVVNEGKKKIETSRLLNIPESTIRRIVNNYIDHGKIEANKRGGYKPSKLTENIKNTLVSLINDDNLYTVSDLIDKIEVDVSVSTVWRWLKKLNFSWKLVRPINPMRNNPAVKLERMEYANWMMAIPFYQRYRNIIFIDESPFNLQMIRSHAWQKVGVTPNPMIPVSKGPNITMILAINCVNIVHSEAIVGVGVNSELFCTFLNSLKNVLGTDESYTIVMDNVKFHHSNQEFFDDYPYEVKYLPRYSPFLNPCEETFSHIKCNVRRNATLHGTNDLIQRMRDSCSLVTSTYLSNFVQHCESFFPKCLTQEDIGRE